MERHGKLVFLLLVLLSLGVGSWIVFGGGSGGGTSPDETETRNEPPGAGLEVRSTLSAEADAPRRPSPERTTVEEDTMPLAHDDAIVAALATFVGRVVSHDGKPAPERMVRFFRMDPQIALQPGRDMLSDPLADFPDLVAGEVVTGTDGRFELAGIWPRSFYLVKADADGPNPTLRLADRTPGPAETVDLGDIVLKNAGVITGRVVDESGDPVAGALVRAADVPPMLSQFVPIEQFDPEGWIIGGNGDERMVVEMPDWVRKYWKHLPVPSALSGEDGAFRLEGVEPGVNLVAATRPGFLIATQKNVKVDPGQERSVGKLVLREGEVASGRVVDPSGKPIPGVQVIVGSRLTMAPVAFGREAGVSDAEGRFECSGLTAGDIVAAARRAPGEPWTITEPQSLNKDVLITLAGRHALTVRLVSEAGQPLTSPRLRLLNVGRNGGGDELAVFATLGFARQVPLEKRRRELEDGRIQLVDLEAARYTLMATADGHAAAIESVDLTSDREVEVRLGAARGIDVLVTDTADRPIRNAAVYLELKGRGPDLFPMHAGRTDAEGKLRIERASRDSAVVEATHPRYGAAAVRTVLPPPGTVVIRLAEPGVIEGEVTEDGKPPEPGKYMVVASKRDETSGPVSGMPSMTVLATDGTFALRGLQPGSWHVEVVKSVQAISSFGSMAEMMMMARMMDDLPEQDVELGAGKTVQVRLETNAPRVVEGPSANVSGTAFVDGRAAEGMIVHGWSEQRLSAKVDAGGQFDLGPVKEGHVYLRLVDMGDGGLMNFDGELWSQMVEVKSGNDVRLTIEVSTGGLSGVVLDLSGRPAAGVPVSAERVSAPGENAARGGRSRSMTDAEGRFDLPRLAAGNYRVVAHSENVGQGHASVQVPVSGRATVRIDLQRTFRVSGTLDRRPLALPEDQQWVWMSFERVVEANETAPRNRGGAQVDDDGSFQMAGLLPGRYRVQVHSNAPGDWRSESLVEVLDRDLTDVAVVPVKIEPPKERNPQTRGR